MCVINRGEIYLWLRYYQAKLEARAAALSFATPPVDDVPLRLASRPVRL